MAEHHGGNQRVIEALIRFVVKQTLGQTPPRRHRHRRECGGAGVVAHGVDAGYIGVLVGVHRDKAMLVHRHPGGLKVEFIGGWRAPGGPNHAIGVVASAIGQHQREAAVGLADDFLRCGLAV